MDTHVELLEMLLDEAKRWGFTVDTDQPSGLWYFRRGRVALGVNPDSFVGLSIAMDLMRTSFEPDSPIPD